MGRLISRRWVTEAVSGVRALTGRSCEYQAYVPDALADRNFQRDGDVAADVADAEPAIGRLEVNAAALTDTEALARLLLRAESVASSRIEGLEIGPRRLIRVEDALERGAGASDVGAEEILGNIEGDGSGPGVLGGFGERSMARIDGDSQGASREHPAAGVRRTRAHI